jgi:hypothetical protein
VQCLKTAVFFSTQGHIPGGQMASIEYELNNLNNLNPRIVRADVQETTRGKLLYLDCLAENVFYDPTFHRKHQAILIQLQSLDYSGLKAENLVFFQVSTSEKYFSCMAWLHQVTTIRHTV